MQKEEHYMESILYVGMDVHTTNYTLCTYSIEEETEETMGTVLFVSPVKVKRKEPSLPFHN